MIEKIFQNLDSKTRKTETCKDAKVSRRLPRKPKIFKAQTKNISVYLEVCSVFNNLVYDSCEAKQIIKTSIRYSDYTI